MAARKGKAFVAAEASRLLGEITLIEGAKTAAPGVALAHFERALEMARQQGALAFELRDAISLSRLWAQGGQVERGIELLAPLSAAFKEGSDTADLRVARSSLSQWQRRCRRKSPKAVPPAPLKPS